MDIGEPIKEFEITPTVIPVPDHPVREPVPEPVPEPVREKEPA